MFLGSSILCWDGANGGRCINPSRQEQEYIQILKPILCSVRSRTMPVIDTATHQIISLGLGYDFKALSGGTQSILSSFKPYLCLQPRWALE